MCYSGALPAPLRQAGAGHHTLLLPAPAAPPFVPKFRPHHHQRSHPLRFTLARAAEHASRLPSTEARIRGFFPSRRRRSPPLLYWTGVGTRMVSSCFGCAAGPTIANVDDHTESEVAMGYTMTQICDKFIEFFMHDKPQTKDWRKILMFREDWRRYSPHFYKHCQVRIDLEIDSSMKQKLVVIARKVKKIDDEIEKHMELFTELRENPADINAVVARRRKDFTGDLVASFSGGWQMRMSLGKILLQDPDLLLLDEPTNHVDLDTIEWLESYLKTQEVPMIIISHDRAFLDQLCTKIVETEFGVSKTYKGNYSEYVLAKAIWVETQYAAWEKQQKEIE